MIKIITRIGTIGTIRTSEEGTTLEMIGMKVNMVEEVEDILRSKICHMTEAKVGMEMILEDLG